MKQIIRCSTFETNSSSMHSLVITKKAHPYTEWEKTLHSGTNDKKFYLWGYCADRDDMFFERSPMQVLNTPLKKLRYYVAHYIGTLNQTDKIKDVEALINKLTNIPEKDILLYSEIDCYFDDDKTEKYYGYAGNNDTGEDVFVYIEKNNISLEEFVMNPNYVVITDGDEYEEFKHMFDSGLINLDNIEYISSGKDFWSSSVECLSMYYLNRFADNDSDVWEEFIGEMNDYFRDFIETLVIEDFECDRCRTDEVINQDSLDYVAIFLQQLKINNPKCKVKLLLGKNKKEDYSKILEYVDEINTSI